MLSRERSRTLTIWGPRQSTQAAVLTLVLSASLAPPSLAQNDDFSRRDLIQPFVGDELSQWMIGAISHIATEAEARRFQALRSEEEGRAFVEEFWQAREKSGRDGLPLFDLFETRALEADDRYTEGHILGRRTDRGTVYVLYGQPETTEYEELRDITEPDVEMWTYPKKSEKGMDGKKPRRIYRFARRGDVVRMYRGPSQDELRRRARTRPF